MRKSRITFVSKKMPATLYCKKGNMEKQSNVCLRENVCYLILQKGNEEKQGNVCLRKLFTKYCKKENKEKQSNACIRENCLLLNTVKMEVETRLV